MPVNAYGLPLDYYLRNFARLLEVVEAWHGDLLSTAERRFIAAFRGQSPPAQRLFIRLIARKGPHFRADHLEYPEIPCFREAAVRLQEADLLGIDDPAAIPEVLDLLTRPEVLEMRGTCLPMVRGGTAAFHEARRDLIAARLHRIGTGEDWPDLCRRHLESKQGLANPFVTWSHLSPEAVELAVSAIPGADLVPIFARLARSPADASSGFPDLLLFPTAGKGYELVEVKGPNDQLQLNQRRWLREFAHHGIPYRVLRIAWVDGGA